MEQTKGQSNSYTAPLMALTVLFFMWGFITCLNDMLIPYFKNVFELSHFQANLVQLAFFMAYFVISLLYFVVSAVKGDPIRKIGYKTTILLGLLISACACLLFFYEAGAETPEFPVFLSALFLLGTGFTFLQISANPLVSILGTQESASSRLNLSQGFNALGTTLAPVFGGYLIFTVFNEGEGARAVQVPYLCLAGVLILLGVLIFFSDIPNIKGNNANYVDDRLAALKYPHLVFGMLAIFFYVGGEVAIGSNLVGYMKEEVGGLFEEETVASKFLSFYWGGAMIGRFAGSVYMGNMSQSKKLLTMIAIGFATFGLIFWLTGLDLGDILYFFIFMALNFVAFVFAKGVPSRTLGVFATVNILLISGMLLTNGVISLWHILAVGLFNSIMFSNIFTLAIKWLGEYTSQASSLLVMMILGGAVMPPLQGLLADNIGIHLAFALPIICYAYLAWYGFIGCNIKSKKMSYTAEVVAEKEEE